MEGLQSDIAAEGGREPITVTISRFNSTSLENFIISLQRSTPRYQLARYNCSNVVADCLKVACEVGPSFTPSAKDYGRLGKLVGRGIWTPNEVLRYARELEKRQNR